MKTQDDSLSPEPLFEMACAYWRSATLFAALDLNLFVEIGDNKTTISDLCEKMDIPKRSTAILLEGLRDLGLVLFEDDQIELTSLSKQFLLPGNPMYLAESIRFNARTYDAWGQLAEATKKNEPAQNHELILGEDPVATRNFVYAMHQRALGVAKVLVSLLDLSGVKNLLDVGGGPGTYSEMLLNKYPTLNSTVFDMRAIVEEAAKLHVDSPVVDRLNFQPGDMYECRFPDGHDAIMFSGVLHRAEGTQLEEILTAAYEVLPKGGKLIISDLFIGVERSGPVSPELFSIHMMLTSHSGTSIYLKQIYALYHKLGLKIDLDIHYPDPLPHYLVLATK
ncbi:MAG: methyltransferase domain-containing protein [Lentisphaeria bacterium]|nr:methyltransferase domain-containing protein [Lentisphaeria bacterium]